MVFSQVTASEGVSIRRSVVVNAGMDWHVEVEGKRVPSESTSLVGAPTTVKSSADLSKLLQHVDACNTCGGNPDEKYKSIAGTGYCIFHSGMLLGLLKLFPFRPHNKQTMLSPSATTLNQMPGMYQAAENTELQAATEKTGRHWRACCTKQPHQLQVAYHF